MSAPSVHDQARDALLERTGHLPEPLLAHVATCAACRDLERSHAVAVQWRHLPTPPTKPVEWSRVLRQARGRRLRRALGGATTALLVLTLHWASQQSPQGSVEQDVDLPGISRDVDAFLRRDVVVQDELYAPFGSLAVQLAPPEHRPPPPIPAQPRAPLVPTDG